MRQIPPFPVRLSRALALERLMPVTTRGWIAAGALVVAVAFGVYGIWDATRWWVAALALVFALVAGVPKFDETLGRVVSAAVLGTLTLVGFNVIADKLFDWLDLGRLPIVAGLVAAVLVFGASAAAYLRWARWPWRFAGPVAGATAVALIVIVPILLAAGEPNATDVPASQRVASQLDAIVVTDGSVHPQPPPQPADVALRGFDVRYSVGYAHGSSIRWTLADGADPAEALRVAAEGRSAPPVAPPVARQGADRVVALLVDGTAPALGAPAALPDVAGGAGEVDRWRAVARAAAPGGTPTFALLQTTRASRLRDWQDFVRAGQPVSLERLGNRSAIDVAARLGIAAPTSEADLALALAHRPVLLFDGSEKVPLPLSVDWLFSDGRVRLCHDRAVVRTTCEQVTTASDLENGGTHMQLTLPGSRELRRIAIAQTAGDRPGSTPPAPGAPGAPPMGMPAAPAADAAQPAALGPDSAIYVHPVSVERAGRSLLYLDYWWYLPDNPSGVGGGAFCGAGLVIPGISCDNHQSDWEGMTVVVDRTTDKPVVTSVQYAEHAAVVSFPWQQLRRRWDSDSRLKRLDLPADASLRPLAFVASGTHASYPLPCYGGCHQIAAPALGDGPHRGTIGWVGNHTAACGAASCVQALPTREGGTQPALWSAFTGTWGEKHCALTYYCDSGSPPTAPGSQGRYKHPTRCTGVVDARWHFRPRPCD